MLHRNGIDKHSDNNCIEVLVERAVDTDQNTFYVALMMCILVV